MNQQGKDHSVYYPNEYQSFIFVTRVTRLIHNAGIYLLISIYPLPTHPTHNLPTNMVEI